MILLLHIIVACSSLVYSGIVFIKPSKTKLNVAYSLVALTLVTGFYLVISKPVALTQTCITGLAYLAFTSVGIFAARRKLVGQINS